VKTGSRHNDVNIMSHHCQFSFSQLPFGEIENNI
jgi:hypothetical protein